MSFKSEVDTEAERLITQGVSPMEALKQAVRIVSERKMAAVDQSEGDGGETTRVQHNIHK
jgi:hypothetical protein